MACNHRYPTNIENSSTQNKRLIIYYMIVSMNLFEVKMFNIVIKSIADICEIAARQRNVCYFLYEIADNYFIDCIFE